MNYNYRHSYTHACSCIYFLALYAETVLSNDISEPVNMSSTISNKGGKGSLEELLCLDLGRKSAWALNICGSRKGSVHKIMGVCQKDPQANLKGLQWPNQGHFEQHNK
jgi:hypothetical protein